MKKIILLCAIAGCVSWFQVATDEDYKKLSTVVECDYPADELYVRLRLWAIDNYPDVELNDTEQRMRITSSTSWVSPTQKYHVLYYHLIVNTVNGRYAVHMRPDIVREEYGGWIIPVYRVMLPNYQAEFQKNLESIREFFALIDETIELQRRANNAIIESQKSLAELDLYQTNPKKQKNRKK